MKNFIKGMNKKGQTFKSLKESNFIKGMNKKEQELKEKYFILSDAKVKLSNFVE